MELAVLLPIAAFIALAAGLAVVLQRTGRIVARTRELEDFKTTSSTSRRASTRRSGARPARSMPSAGVSSRPTRSARRSRPRPTPCEKYADEARALRGPARRTGSATTSSASWSGRSRALGMVEHGTTMLLNSRPRELEARDVDQARLPQPDPRPGGDRPPRARLRRSCPDADDTNGRALTPATTPSSGILGRHHYP